MAFFIKYPKAETFSLCTSNNFHAFHFNIFIIYLTEVIFFVVSKVTEKMDPPKYQEYGESNNGSVKMKSKISPSIHEPLTSSRRGRPRKTKVIPIQNL